jgi:hypothetical protein
MGYWKKETCNIIMTLNQYSLTFIIKPHEFVYWKELNTKKAKAFLKDDLSVSITIRSSVQGDDLITLTKERPDEIISLSLGDLY